MNVPDAADTSRGRSAWRPDGYPAASNHPCRWRRLLNLLFNNPSPSQVSANEFFDLVYREALSVISFELRVRSSAREIAV